MFIMSEVPLYTGKHFHFLMTRTAQGCEASAGLRPLQPCGCESWFDQFASSSGCALGTPRLCLQNPFDRLPRSVLEQ